MNYKLAIEILEIEEIAPGDEDLSVNMVELIKRQYRMKALKYHPDKNRDIDASERFYEVKEAYDFLMNYYAAGDLPYLKTDTSYQNILLSFILQFYKDNAGFYENGDGIERCSKDFGNQICFLILKKIIGICEKKALSILEKLDHSLLIIILRIARQYSDVFHFSDSFIRGIEEICINKNLMKECIILHPCLDDLLEHNLYKLNYNGEIYIIPLWHHELVYDISGEEMENTKELIVQCYPVLPDHIEMDDKNNILVTLFYNIEEIWNKESMDFYLGSKKFVFYPRDLKMVPIQKYVIKQQGISRIQTKDIYNISVKQDIIVTIHINMFEV